MGKRSSRVACPQDVKTASLLRIDNLLGSTMNRIRIVVMTHACSYVFEAHFDVAMPFGIARRVEARRFEKAVLRQPLDFYSSAGWFM